MGADQTHADNHYELYFCDDTATTEIYTLSLHDALPISKFGRDRLDSTAALGASPNTVRDATVGPNAANGTIDFRRRFTNNTRSEEHTSELQSRQYLVCRLLLEKKKLYLHALHA